VEVGGVMRRLSWVLFVVAVLSSQVEAELVSYHAWSEVNLELVGFRDASGASLSGKPNGLTIEAEAGVSDEWTITTGGALATNSGYALVEADDPFDAQIADGVRIRGEAEGQALSGIEYSEAVFFGSGSMYMINTDPYVDFRLDWDYGRDGPSFVSALASDLFMNFYLEGWSDGGLPVADSGGMDLRLLVEAYDFNQLLIGAGAEGVVAVPTPSSVVLGLGMLCFSLLLIGRTQIREICGAS
jgi:hypothetical protein